MDQSKGVPLWRYACDCGELLELGRADELRDVLPDCPRCGHRMARAKAISPIAVPEGAQLRSGNCRACRARVLLQALDWDGHCGDCQASRKRHVALGAPLEEWRAPELEADRVARLLLD